MDNRGQEETINKYNTFQSVVITIKIKGNLKKQTD